MQLVEFAGKVPQRVADGGLDRREIAHPWGCGGLPECDADLLAENLNGISRHTERSAPAHPSSPPAATYAVRIVLICAGSPPPMMYAHRPASRAALSVRTPSQSTSTGPDEDVTMLWVLKSP